MKKNDSLVSRRSFLGGLAAGGALAALPVFARTRFKRVNLVFADVKIGLDTPFSALHISDTHLTLAHFDEDPAAMNLSVDRTDAFGGDQLTALRDSIGYARQNKDIVLHTGDLSDYHSRANFEQVKNFFGKNCAMMCAGNHEFARFEGWEYPEWIKRQREPEYKAFCAKLAQPYYPYNLTFDSRVINGVNFVGFDDTWEWIPDEVFDRFADEVKKGLPIVILCHVPFYTPATEAAAKHYWGADTAITGSPSLAAKHPKTNAFVERLRQEPLIKAVLAGDLHVTVHDRFSPTAMQYTVGGNYDRVACRISFS